MLDALALGVPVVATDVDGLPEALARGGGMLVPSESPVELAAVVERLLGNAAERSRLAAEGRAAAEYFSVRSIGGEDHRRVSFDGTLSRVSMIYFCIPAHDEAATIGLVLWKIRRVLEESAREYQLLVGDDGSSDATAEVLEPYAKVLPLTVFRSPTRQGYAATVEVAAQGGAPAIRSSQA